ncbi:ribosomal protein S6 modification protein RimK [Pseudomonas aeruginosa]|nr:ribosomal protein S6 modification protein RimK [Pseudomonas aeruginosa]
MKTFDQLSVIGLREWIAFPELGMVGLRAKIDTGASTSSLHASDIVPFERDGEKWVRFTAHLGTLVQRRHRCEAPMVARKTIRSSNGQAQTRYVIRTTLALGDRMWPVEFTLACRKSMRYRVLLGSKALIAGQLVVNPALAYVQDRPESPAALPAATGIKPARRESGLSHSPAAPVQPPSIPETAGPMPAATTTHSLAAAARQPVQPIHRC